jgi:hypothetical protein
MYPAVPYKCHEKSTRRLEPLIVVSDGGGEGY